MRARIVTILLAAVGGVLAWYAGADSAERPRTPQATATRVAAPDDDAGLWASINKCDTARAPDTVGIRGSMPSLGKRKTVASMRFRVQFKRPSDGAWIDAGPSAASGWKRLGVISDTVIESGQDFTFEPPKTGHHTLRGVVDFRWSRKGIVLRQRSRTTTAGHPSSAGGDPAGHSAATCQIS